MNVAVPVTINRLHAETYIADGTDVNANDVTVHTDANTSARSLELGAAGGLVAIGIGVSAVIDEPTVYTYIGMSPKLLEEEGADLSNVENGKVTVNGDIEVSHTVRSNATPEMLVLADGGVSVNGNLLFACNRTKAVSGIFRTNVEAKHGTVNVSAYAPDVKAESKFAAASVGAFAVGLSSSYAQLRMRNEALMDITNVLIDAKNISVTAGKNETYTDESGKVVSLRNNAIADAAMVSANVRDISGGINAAIADNNVTNRARVFGTGGLDASGKINTEAWLDAQSDADVIGLSAAGITVVGSVPIALNRVSNIAEIDTNRISGIEGITVHAALNEKADRNNDQEAVTEAAKAGIQNGVGSASGAVVNTAIARSWADNIAFFGVTDTEEPMNCGNLDVRSTGYDYTKVTADDLPGCSAGAALMQGYAKTYGTFKATVKFPDIGFEGDEPDIPVIDVSVMPVPVIVAEEVNISADYFADAAADVSPSAGGVNSFLASEKRNIAFAVVGNEAEASVTGVGNIVSDGDIDVKAKGTVGTNAVIEGSGFSEDNIDVTASYSRSSVTAKQSAFIEGTNRYFVHYNGVVSSDGNISVLSELDTAGRALIGADKSTADSVTVKPNAGKVTSDVSNSAYLSDAITISKKGNITVNADLNSCIYSVAEGCKASDGVSSAGTASAESDSNDTVQAYVTGKSYVAGKQVDITAKSEAAVDVLGSLSEIPVTLDGYKDVKVNAAAASGSTGKVTKAWIGTDSEVSAIGQSEPAMSSLNVKADSDLTVTARIAELPDTANTSGMEFGARKWQPTPVFLPGKSYGRRSLLGFSPWGCKELETLLCQQSSV